MDNLVVLNNEKVSNENGKFYSRNYNFKILPEGLDRYFKVEYIVRKSNVKENHELNLESIKIASNIIQFISFVISTFKNKNSKYFLICISPYTFIAFLLLLLFRKKVFVYLISSGHEEWKFILGSWSVWIYEIMYSIVTSNSTVIALHDRLYKKKKGHVISSSTFGKIFVRICFTFLTSPSTNSRSELVFEILLIYSFNKFLCIGLRLLYLPLKFSTIIW